jgi:AcrR family transcriptional regulator
MAVTDGRQRRKVALRASILEAAREILKVEGLRSLTMRRIGEAIDYSPASLYAHFESRDRLLAQLCTEGFTALRVALERSAEGVFAPRERLGALAHGYLRFALEHPETYRLIFMEDSALTKGVFESLESDDGMQALALIVAPFAELRAAGALPESANPMLLADLLWTVVHGIASLRLSCPAMPASADGALIDAAIASIAA